MVKHLGSSLATRSSSSTFRRHRDRGPHRRRRPARRHARRHQRVPGTYAQLQEAKTLTATHLFRASKINDDAPRKLIGKLSVEDASANDHKGVSVDIPSGVFTAGARMDSEPASTGQDSGGGVRAGS
jgi:hypothetical protein